MNNIFWMALITLCMALLASCSLTGDKSEEPMVLVFNTIHGEGTTVTLPLQGKVNVTIDWGDGTEMTTKEPGLLSHTYAGEGRYTVKIFGKLTQFGLGSQPYPNTETLTRVVCFGDIGLTSLSGAFHESGILVGLPDALPTSVKDLSYMFAHAKRFNLELNHWDMSGTENLSHMFYGAETFNQPLDQWNVHQVHTMESMFRDTRAFNQPIGSWVDSNVTNMAGMFNKATAFNQDLSNWDTGRVESMEGMFMQAGSFNQPISGWNVSHVRNMARMFSGATAFNQDISHWDTGRVETMEGMFSQTSSFNQPIGSWNVSNVRSMQQMFWLANAFDQPLSAWDVRNVKNMENIFTGRYTEASYDDLLINWAALPLQPFVVFGGGQNQYQTTEGKEARKRLAEDHLWNVFDGSGHSVRVYSTHGKIAGQGSYLEGDTVILTAIPDPGYQFGYWEGYGVENAGDSIFSFIADDKSRLLRVQWERPDKDAMVLEVNTRVSPGTSVTLPLKGKTDLLVDWGDGQVERVSNPGLITHQYFHEGIYHITLQGTLEQFGNGAKGYEHAEKLTRVTQFGSLGLKSLSGAFYGNRSLSKISFDLPPTVTDMSFLFYGAKGVPFSISYLDVGSVTNMQSMFEGADVRLHLADWDVSNVTNMNDLFKDSHIPTHLYNPLLIQWADLPLQDSVHLNAGTSQYSLGRAAEARQRIIDTFHWTIIDGGDDGLLPPAPFDLTTLNYDSISLWFYLDDPFSDHVFVGGHISRLDRPGDIGLRFFVLNEQKEFLYVSPGWMDSRSLQADIFRETDAGFLPVHEIDPAIHSPIEGSPLIIMVAGGDEHGSSGSQVYFLENDSIRDIGYLKITQYSVNHWFEESYQAVGEFASIDRLEGGYRFRFDTNRVAFYPGELSGREEILDGSDFYYLFDGKKLIFVREE